MSTTFGELRSIRSASSALPRPSSTESMSLAPSPSAAEAAAAADMMVVWVPERGGGAGAAEV